VTTGNHAIFQALERELCKFFEADAALLTPDGYTTNMIVAQSLAGTIKKVYIDDRAHAALRDATRFLDCPIQEFEHRNPASLARLARRDRTEGPALLLTDGMFALNGSIAPLAEYRRIMPRDTIFLVDDAHGAGVVGRTGKGSLEEEGVSRTGIIQTVALSKAIGAFGGAILATGRLRQLVLEKSRAFAGAIPVPLPIASAAVRSLQLLQSSPEWLRRLRQNKQTVVSCLGEGGIFVPPSPGPIVRLEPINASASTRVCAALSRAGIYPPFLRYPPSDPKGYFRIVVSSEHSRRELLRLVSVLTPLKHQFVQSSPKQAPGCPK